MSDSAELKQWNTGGFQVLPQVKSKGRHLKVLLRRWTVRCAGTWTAVKVHKRVDEVEDLLPSHLLFASPLVTLCPGFVEVFAAGSSPKTIHSWRTAIVWWSLQDFDFEKLGVTRWLCGLSTHSSRTDGNSKERLQYNHAEKLKPPLPSLAALHSNLCDFLFQHL